MGLERVYNFNLRCNVPRKYSAFSVNPSLHMSTSWRFPILDGCCQLAHIEAIPVIFTFDSSEVLKFGGLKCLL